MKKQFLFAYDVREPKRLRRAAKLLEGYGTRIQYSLFRCRLNERELERLRWQLTKTLEPEDDLLIIPLCQACVSRISSRGTAWPEKEPRFEIL